MGLLVYALAAVGAFTVVGLVFGMGFFEVVDVAEETIRGADASALAGEARDAAAAIRDGAEGILREVP